MFSQGATPYADLNVTEIVELVLSGHQLRRPSVNAPLSVVELIRECTQLNVAKRPAMFTIEKWLTKAVDNPEITLFLDTANVEPAFTSENMMATNATFRIADNEWVEDNEESQL